MRCKAIKYANTARPFYVCWSERKGIRSEGVDVCFCRERSSPVVLSAGPSMQEYQGRQKKSIVALGKHLCLSRSVYRIIASWSIIGVLELSREAPRNSDQSDLCSPSALRVPHSRPHNSLWKPLEVQCARLQFKLGSNYNQALIKF